MAQKKTKQDYHHGELKSTLIEVALKILKTKPPSELSLRELARKAGVSQAAPYRHFKDKNELLAAISAQGFQIKTRYMLEAIEKYKHDPEEMYYRSGLSYLQMGQKHPQHFRLMFSSELHPMDQFPELKQAAATTFALVKQMVQIGQDAGFIGPGDAYHKAMHCWTVVHGFTILYAEGHFEWLGVTERNVEEAFKILMRQILHGTKSELQKGNAVFSPFMTKETAPHKEMMEMLVSSILKK